MLYRIGVFRWSAASGGYTEGKGAPRQCLPPQTMLFYSFISFSQPYRCHFLSVLPLSIFLSFKKHGKKTWRVWSGNLDVESGVMSVWLAVKFTIVLCLLLCCLLFLPRYSYSYPTAPTRKLLTCLKISFLVLPNRVGSTPSSFSANTYHFPVTYFTIDITNTLYNLAPVITDISLQTFL